MDIPSVKKEILTKLLKNNGLRYSEAMPENVESDLYNYHLKHLVTLGLVEKSEDKYFLTTEGKHYVEVIVPISPLGTTAELFRVNTLIILVKEEKGKRLVLNQTRKRHPYYGNKGIIGGIVKKGELLKDTYKRVLKEETGLMADFETIGTIRKIRRASNDELYTDIFCHVGLATACTGNLVELNDFGENFWVDFDTAIENEKTSIQGGKSILKVLELVRSSSLVGQCRFFYEEVMSVSS